MEEKHRLRQAIARVENGFGSEEGMSLLDQLKHFPHGLGVVRDWIGSGGEIVSQEQAEARAKVCLTCPKHDPTTPLARPVAKAVNEILAVMNSVKLNLRIPVRPNQCSVCGCDLRTKVWEPLDQVINHSTINEMAGYWEKCWIKQESK